jgi:hypothetical protein
MIDEGGGPGAYIQDRLILIQGALLKKFQGCRRIGLIPAKLSGWL